MWRKEIMELDLKDRTKNDIQKFLKILLNFATRWYGFNFNEVYPKIVPFKNPNEKPREEMLFFTHDEFKKFISVEKELRYKVAFEILYYCGTRRGEVLGLPWKYVDFEKHEISIKQNLVKDFIGNKDYIITSPKTRSSIRTIPMTRVLEEDLKSLKDECKKIYGFNDEWFVLGYAQPMSKWGLRVRKNENCKKAGVKQIRLHDFRHSCASALISQGANITLVARYLGHAKIDETLNTYGHFYKSDLDSIISKLDDLDK
jgi:integrase